MSSFSKAAAVTTQTSPFALEKQMDALAKKYTQTIDMMGQDGEPDLSWIDEPPSNGKGAKKTKVAADPLAEMKANYSKTIKDKMAVTLGQAKEMMEKEGRVLGKYVLGPLVFNNILVGTFVDGKIKDYFLLPEEMINLAIKQKKMSNLRKKLSNQRAGKGSREIIVDDKIDINDILDKLIKHGK
uniref:Uncharacterized protein n=1 Tax=viral metagenome TaxID=1070528 RepID=A0A6C0F417_9ZZZZ